ncbi:MAG: UDP binding domain-containing protein, partial [Anaerolineae bacterium]|nr:UDP binding domain-containing protein [Anaerolineae bacterium]
ALDIIHLLQEKGAMVSFHDPHVPTFRHDGMTMKGESDLVAALDAADCVVVATDHSAYDWEDIARRARVLVDTRHIIE